MPNSTTEILQLDLVICTKKIQLEVLSQWDLSGGGLGEHISSHSALECIWRLSSEPNRKKNHSFLQTSSDFPLKYHLDLKIFRQWNQFSKRVMDIHMKGYSSDYLARASCIQCIVQHDAFFKSQVFSMQCKYKCIQKQENQSPPLISLALQSWMQINRRLYTQQLCFFLSLLLSVVNATSSNIKGSSWPSLTLKNCFSPLYIFINFK